MFLSFPFLGCSSTLSSFNFDLFTQSHLSLLIKEIDRLQNRVKKLDSHFSNAQNDLNEIVTTTKKLTSKTQKIVKIDMQE